MVSLNNIDPDRVPSAKMAVHGLQIVLVFVAWALEIAVFRDSEAKITGQNGWFFGVCFLSIPAWVYVLMTPRWERTRHLADPRAMLGVDILFSIIWLSAFAAQATYNGGDRCGGACGISKAIVAFGVFVTILWILAVVISFYTYHHWKLDGYLPGYDHRKLPNSNNIDPDKAAFSMAPHDEEAYAPVNMDERESGRNDDYASGAYGGAPYGGSHAGGRTDPYDDDDRYDNGSNVGSNVGSHMGSNVGGRHGRTSGIYEGDTSYGAPSSTQSGPAQFPSGNYDRVH
ncbi:unnamed protein product [Parascedosporium putredinis]|uniref:MARVEL domain-containing protein n=1 Tax=Parascedosporium putredinis TaxID=1442378 RepID=A0A9P1GZL6_9PEZI|nr:unnamed protein product [Parascedosporium putredinis]CAI7993010.1 unnamed protein product [Parascedosporium putredinis]